MKNESQVYELALDFAKNEMAPNMKQWDLEARYILNTELLLLLSFSTHK